MSRPGTFRRLIAPGAHSVLLAAGCFVLATAARAEAQTPATALGLGLPVPSIDARSAGLGGTGLGFADGSLSARNPADLALFGQPVLGITYAPEGVSVKGADESASTGRSRMAVLRGAIPFDRWAAGVAFAGELDQDWQVSFSDTLEAEEGTFPFVEQRSQDGGLSSVNFTLARQLGRVSLGAEYAIMTGHLQQRYRRDFEPAIDDPDRMLNPSAGVADWDYGGSRFRFGVAASVSDRLNVGADFSLQSALTAERDTIAGESRTRTVDMPSAVEVGASARVSDRLMVTGAGGWTGWSGAGSVLQGYTASDVVWMGVGAELTGARLLGANVPLRLGLRRTDLPFHAPGAEQLAETALTLGLGMRVADEQARVDLALEIGSRGDLEGSGTEESFQRLSITLALFQD